MKNKPIFILKQNIWYPVGAIAFAVCMVLILFYVVELHGKAPQNWKIMIASITIFVVVVHSVKRILSWEFLFFEDKLTISRPFGFKNKTEKDISLSDIKKVHLSLGYRRDCQLLVHTKSGKRFVSFFDVRKIHAPAELIALFLKNGIEFDSSGGKWNF